MMYNIYAGKITDSYVYFTLTTAIISIAKKLLPDFFQGGCFMEITDVKIRKLITEGRLRASVSVTFDNMLAVHDIKVVQGEERLFAAMPSRKDENGIFRDVVHPITAEARKELENAVLDAYERQLAESEESKE